MKVYRTEKIIERKKVQSNPDVLYLFGDNDARRGLGGQAKEMRGEPNTVGISTKKLPNNEPSSFKTDEEFQRNIEIISYDIINVLSAIKSGKYKALVIPQIGVGKAKLPQNAPMTFNFLQTQLLFIECIAKAQK